MSNLDLTLPVNDRNRLPRNFAGHAGGFTRGDVERTGVEGAFHDFSVDDAFLRQGCRATGDQIRRGIDRTRYLTKSDLRSIEQGSLFDLSLDDLVGSTKYDCFGHETWT
jgi:hypothetical protein